MDFIELNRRFDEWTAKDEPDSDMRAAFGLPEAGIDWNELLLKRRAVILAEAGSGKTTEMKHRAEAIAADHQYAFYATLQDIGRYGLDSALARPDHERLIAWRNSADNAWFFLDSVDEAKSDGFRLETVLRKIADGIRGAESRARVLLSGRVTDWEFRRDLRSVNKLLDVPAATSSQLPTFEEELLTVLRKERDSDDAPPASEAAFVARMTVLDRNRVRLFAQGKSLPNVDHFLETIESANLWHFARRPLDLAWLVRFWQQRGRLGSLAEMIEPSITERLKETNPDRARGDVLDSTRALRAIERVAAALVFGRRSTIAIPDGEMNFTTDSSLNLADILPDWPDRDRALLLTRPIFDSPTLGRARFHNDNEGIVRGYLAARWIHHLRGENLPTRALFELLFAKTYGLEVIPPSLYQTVAWLSLWDKDVAKEVVRRVPLLLLGAGDPASLPFDARRSALTALVEALASGDHERLAMDHASLRRFAQPDLGAVVLALWPQYRHNPQAAQLLMQIVWRGEFRDCMAIAEEVVRDGAFEALTRAFAGRTVLAVGDARTQEMFARYVMSNHSALPADIVHDAVMDLFPSWITVLDLLELLKAFGAKQGSDSLRFRWDGPRLVRKITSPSDLAALLPGLLSEVGIEYGDHAHYDLSEAEESYFPAIAETSLRLLQLSPPDSAPAPVIDAILRICNRNGHGARAAKQADPTLAELHRTPARRRAAFWRVAHNLRNTVPCQHRLHHVWEMIHLGYPPGLQVEDVDWLLADGLASDEHDSRLAVDAAFAVYVSSEKTPELLRKMRAAVDANEVAAEVLRGLTTPREVPAEEARLQRQLARMEQENATAQQKTNQSWIDFIRELRADPQRIQNLATPPSPAERSELFQLWRLLSHASRRSNYALDSIGPLEKFAGPEVASAAKDGLMAYWRTLAPSVRSEKEPKDRNSVRWVELMGLVGVSLEAATVTAWADRLSADEAIRAAEYATLEINGFPSWFTGLALSRPAEVRAVVMREIVDELGRMELDYYHTINTIAQSGAELAALLAEPLLNDLERRSPIPAKALTPILGMIVEGLATDLRPWFKTLATQRFGTEADLAAGVKYLAAVFSLDPEMALDALMARVKGIEPERQAPLVNAFLLAAFGDWTSGATFKSVAVPSTVLEQLLVLSYETCGQLDEGKDEGGFYQPGENGSEARNVLFNRFINTPGAATYQGLLRLQSNKHCSIPSSRLRAFAEDRALKDSESEPWPPSEALEFEQHFETAPHTPKDLQRVLIGRLEDIQHELVDGDYSQGLTLRGLPNEVDVQNWIADRLYQRRGRSYSVEREPHVAGEKEPDVRIQAKAANARVAMEIKVIKPDTWSLKDLDDALEVQLCGRYLRTRDARHGVLLLVHQQPRPKGWRDDLTGAFLSFEQVVERLSARAALIAGAQYDSPIAEICVLDVTGCKRKS